jgi:hypothetical protein
LCATALALHASSGRVSAALTDSTLRAVVGVAAGGSTAAGAVSAEVAALVQGANKAMFYSKAKIATALVLAASAVAIACGVARRGAAAADPPAPQQSPAEQSPADRPQALQDRPLSGAQAKAEAEATVEVRGQVLDPEGNLVPGAKLYLAGSAADGPASAPQARTGPDGRSRLAVPRSELEKGAAGKSPPQVMAVAEGYGCDWSEIGPAAGELTLRLVKDVLVSGRILDPDGEPVAGAKVTVTGVSATGGDDIGSYLEAVRRGDWGYTWARDWVGPLPGRPAVLTTGPDGPFKVAGIGRERVVRFLVEGPAVASAYLNAMTRAGERVAGHGRQVYGASFDYVAVASRPIRGVVRDKDTGKPLAGGIAARPRPTFPDRRTRPMATPTNDWDPKGWWEPYVPGGEAPWDLRRVVHLHRRAGFAATWGELQRDLKDGPGKSIDRLLRGQGREGVPDNFRTVADQLAGGAGEPARLKAWWVYRMYWGPDPLGERLALVWHNHFATSNEKVNDLAAMLTALGPKATSQPDAVRAGIALVVASPEVQMA